MKNIKPFFIKISIYRSSIVKLNNMNVAIIGSRKISIPYIDFEKSVFSIISKDKITKVISGGAKGADSMARHLANVNGIDIIEHIPDWSKGKHAGFERNKYIVNDCDMVIAFWDGVSRGTLDSLKYAESINKEIRIVQI